MMFGPWHPIDNTALRDAPATPCALQVRRAQGLVDYPQGKSAMVFYAFSPSGVLAGLERALADELAQPGARGQGPLWVRWSTDDDAADGLATLHAEFVRRFGAVPLLQGE